MFAHVLTITLAHFFRLFAILPLVRDVDYKTSDVRRFASGGSDHRDHVFQCLVELRDEVFTDNPLVLIPGDLSGDEE
jgi:hypothetical protein